MALIVTGTIASTAMLTGFCFAETLRVELASPDVVKTRLESGEVKMQERQRVIKGLFAEAGCDAEEQPIDKRYGNVICTLPGATNSTIIVGGHFDFVDQGRGLVDDWSGTSLLPSLYHALKALPLPAHLQIRSLRLRRERLGGLQAVRQKTLTGATS